MTSEAVFVQDGAGFRATEIARGPWDPGALHGGAPAALVAHVISGMPGLDGLRLARVTYEFLRPVPLDVLTVDVDVVRPGRRVTVLDATIRRPDATEVARARALLMAPSEAGTVPESPPPFPGPEEGQPSDPFGPAKMFAHDAIEIRFVVGEFRVPGDSAAWFRLRAPLVAGQQPSQLERLLAASDFGNGIGSALSWDEHVFINPDLTVYIEREPVDEWVALDSRMLVAPGRVAVAESVLYDRIGRIGRATQSVLVVDRAPAT